MKEFNESEGRVYLENENKDVIAELTYTVSKENLMEVTRTFVDYSLRGQGIASKLVERAYNIANERNLGFEPVCSYAVKWVEDRNK